MTSPARGLLSRLLTNGQGSVGQAVTRLDGWVNTLTGLGDSLRDKGMASAFVRERPLTPDEADALFHGDDLANRIVTAVPDDALREGIEAVRTVEEADGEVDTDVEDVQDQTTAMANRIRDLEVVPKLREAMTWARCQGGGGILVMADGTGDIATPMDDARVTRLVGLVVVERRDLQPNTYYRDPTSPKFGKVETYYLNTVGDGGFLATTNVAIHETRLVMFGGALTSRRERMRNQGWDHSVLQRVVNILRKTNTAYDSVVAMMNDMSQAVFKITGLVEAMAEGSSEALSKRMALVDMLRSITRAIVLDKDGEDFQVVERSSATGTDALLQQVFLRLAAAARMPVTILMGQTPAGLNATGSIDLRWWYDTVRVAQRHEIHPRAVRLVRLIARELFPGQDPGQWDVTFPSLWQMTPAEEAELRSKVAATDKVYVDMGAVLPEEITLSRFGQGAYSTEYVVDLESRKAMLEAELDKAEAKALQPDPVPPTPPGGPPSAGGAPDPEPGDTDLGGEDGPDGTPPA